MPPEHTINDITAFIGKKLRKQYGEELYKYCLRMATPHLQQGTLEIKNDTLKLTRKGVFISDGIMSDMLWVE